MRKIVFTLVVLSICILANSTAFAQDKNADKALKAQKDAAKKFINATPAVIKLAITQKKKSKKEDGEPLIAKAFDHQKKAVELYNAGTYEKALYHSLKARKYAAISIKQDKGTYEEKADSEVVFKDFKDVKAKENKAFYKSMKKVFDSKKETTIGDAESELESGVEVTEDDSKVDVKQLVNVK